MDVFHVILAQILPLYLLIALGFAAGKWLKVERQSVASLLFYFIAPLVFFSGLARTRISADVLSLPLLMFAVSCAVCALAYWLSGFLWRDKTRNVLAMAAGTANTGYFGLPVAMLLLDAQGVAVYISAMLGISIYESTVGFFVTAKGSHTGRECLGKVLRLPILYAFFLGLAASALELSFPAPLEQLFAHMRGAYVVLGMMIIGLGLSGIASFALDIRFIGFCFAMKFLIWPLAGGAIILADGAFLHLYGADARRSILLLSIVPMAANTVVIAALLAAHPEKVAAAVLLSTLFALLYVPAMAALFLR